MKKALLITLFLIAFLERTVYDLGPNFEFVTGAMILASYFLGRKYAVFLVLSVVLTTDLILGTTNIFIFTWSGFLIPALLLRSNLIKNPSLKRYDLFRLTGFGMGSNVFFYLWTNLGVWLLDSWGMYEKSLQGLIACYLNALPFLKNQFVSSLVFIPLGFMAIEGSLYLIKKMKPASRLAKQSLI